LRFFVSFTTIAPAFASPEETNAVPVFSIYFNRTFSS
jgi:hypothetical protein